MKASITVENIGYNEKCCIAGCKSIAAFTIHTCINVKIGPVAVPQAAKLAICHECKRELETGLRDA